MDFQIILDIPWCQTPTFLNTYIECITKTDIYSKTKPRSNPWLWILKSSKKVKNWTNFI